MRESSNPVMRGVVRDNQKAGGYAGFGTGMAGAGQTMYTQAGQPQQVDPYARPGQPVGSRALTIDDVVTKTAMTLGVLILSSVVSYFLVHQNVALAMPLLLVGAIGGFVLVMIASFGRKQDNPAIVLSYAVLEGLFVGAVSFVFANLAVSGVSAGVLIGQAVLGTFGVFAGMLVVYKTGAIRVTPRFTRMLFAAMMGVIVLILGNLVVGFFNGGSGLGLYDGGPIAIIFSLFCIGLAAFSFLVDFDSADRLIRAGAPARAAWGIALGLTVTLVWLYVEILRLLSYFNQD
ncbi:Bax inhibitor-1/YccA family protein [Williamsia deligens]|uniref:Bax inhibitor-1/YccA family protein n=1 Tax=Williamsia deligens TaxID=321325 RepID=A0ABW3G7W7_9NOCA|nr:Bax inhibitor-1/YccA family protein [Williamsia deligens]MCP2192429.1 putative membrane protein, YccA/Bax inhibitor family [Williamsia deligens]